MTQKTLTDEQARTIAFALIGVKPNLKLYDPKDFHHEIVIDRIESVAALAQLGIQVDFTLIGMALLSRQVTRVRYQFYLSYYETIGEFNSSILALYTVIPLGDEPEKELDVIGNVALVTDLLREYGIW